jgi:hypothetical protein
MLRSSESETEILLGNKQLLGIFFVVAILLGVAFTGGYMVGKANAGKRAADSPVASSSEPGTPPPPSGPAGETHSVPAAGTPDTSNEAASTHSAAPSNETPLGARKKGSASSATQALSSSDATTSERAGNNFAPQTGQQFLQVAAVGRDEATAIADVLHKKGFSAHAVPKPANPKVVRVLIGPIRDAGDLATTRDALHKTGFRDVIVQHY